MGKGESITLGELCSAHGITVKALLDASGLPESTAHRWVTGRPGVLALLLKGMARPKPVPPATVPMRSIGSPYVALLDIETLAKSVNAVIGTIGATVVNVMTGEELGYFYTRIDVSLEQPGRITDEETMAFWEGLSRKNTNAWAEVFDPSLPRGTLRRALESLSEFLHVMGAGGREIEVMGNGPEFDNCIIQDACRTEGVPCIWHFRRNESLRTLVWMGRLLLGADPKYQIPFEGVQHHAGDDSRHEAKVAVAIVRDFSERLQRGGWPHPPAGMARTLHMGVGR